MEHMYLVSYPYESSKTPEEAKGLYSKQRWFSRAALQHENACDIIQHRDSLQRAQRTLPPPPRRVNRYSSSPTAAALASLAFNMKMRSTRGSFLVHQARKRSQSQPCGTVPSANAARHVRTSYNWSYKYPKANEGIQRILR